MAEDGGPPLKRPKISKDEYDKLNKDELIQRLHEQDIYMESLAAKQTDPDGGGDDQAAPRDMEDKLKQQQMEATRRENVLVMRLTTKEQEMQEYLNQIQELKQVRNPAATQLRGMLLDPAVNLMFQRMKKEMDLSKEKLEQAQNDLTAWKFTPDSQTGKRLMAKCSMLLQENEEIGKVISSGRTAKLEGEIALEKKFVQEMKKSQAETDEFLVEMDEDLEGMQSTIYFLQQQLKDSKDEITNLQQENTDLKQQLTHQQSALPSFPEVHTQQETISNTHTDMDTDQNSFNKDSTEGVRTTNITAPSYSSQFNLNTGSNVVSSRTNHAEDEEAVTSSTPYKADHRSHSPMHRTNTDTTTHNNNNNRRLERDHGDRSSPTVAANGAEHMETDISEDPASSDDPRQIERNNSPASPVRNSSRPQSPRPSSPTKVTPPPPRTAPSNMYNHHTSQSSDGPYTCEGTDASSDPWSPSNQSKTSGMVSDEDQKLSCIDKYRTERKLPSSDRLQNGLISNQSFEKPENEIIN